jgi:hypothetical protein
VIIDRLHAGEPLVSGIIVAEAGDLSGGANALTIGIDPDGEEQPGVEGGASGLSLYGVDRLVIEGEVKAARKLPDRPYLVIVRNKTLHIDGAKKELLSVDRFQPWLRLALGQSYTIERLASLDRLESRQIIHGSPSSCAA